LLDHTSTDRIPGWAPPDSRVQIVASCPPKQRVDLDVGSTLHDGFMTTTSAVRVEGLKKAFGDLQVLRGVDFDIERGTIFALLGSNGSGKTTVVRILSTLLKLDVGSAMVHGSDVATQAADVRESISLTGQFAAVDEILTGRENLVMIAKLRHVDHPGQVADEQLERFSLTDAGGRRVATYSGGMRRRLDIAMSLIGNPPVLFLDEPTTGLDPQSRLEVWQSVKALAHGGTTVLLTTQCLDEAEHLADRIAILHEGRILVDGTLAELRALMPPTKVEYVEKQPTLEDIFLALVALVAPSAAAGTALHDTTTVRSSSNTIEV
jgi:ABC-2 type transport system ATP-binding protein